MPDLIQRLYCMPYHSCSAICQAYLFCLPLSLIHILGYKASWLIKSNTELGTGYSDILVEVPNNRTDMQKYSYIPAWSLELLQKDTTNAVSYTHLDVYKRQCPS